MLVLSLMVTSPFPSAATEALVDGSTERLRRRYPISIALRGSPPGEGREDLYRYGAKQDQEGAGQAQLEF
ncbi:MAG: hypothetical protein OJF50_006660 [Nitrospira sp.]|nr:hypothetical protein [Nitrospira sp.]